MRTGPERARKKSKKSSRLHCQIIRRSWRRATTITGGRSTATLSNAGNPSLEASTAWAPGVYGGLTREKTRTHQGRALLEGAGPSKPILPRRPFPSGTPRVYLKARTRVCTQLVVLDGARGLIGLLLLYNAVGVSERIRAEQHLHGSREKHFPRTLGSCFPPVSLLVTPATGQSEPEEGDSGDNPRPRALRQAGGCEKKKA